MAAPKPARLPIIDIAPWLSDDPAQADARAAVSAALHSACVNYGFFYLDISSYVPKEEPEELTALARKFFALPQEEKEKIALRNEDGARGELDIWRHRYIADVPPNQDTHASRRT